MKRWLVILTSLIVLLSFFVPVHAAYIYPTGWMEVTVSPTSTPTIYAEEETQISGTVKNTDYNCPFTTCSYSTTQGKSGEIGFVNASDSKDFSFYVSAPTGCCSPKYVYVTVACTFGSPCSSTLTSKQKTINVYYNYCGDGTCNSEESCSSCPNDCGKCDGEYCSWSYQCKGGYCVHNACRSSSTYCGDGYCDWGECTEGCRDDCSVSNCQYNGQCDTKIGENCENSRNDCWCEYDEECNPSSSRANIKGCAELCGNGKIDHGEDCNNCPTDYDCEGKGLHCGPTGKCEECITTAHCVGKESWLGEFICKGDHRTLLEKGVRTAGICENYRCTGSEDITREAENCGTRYCQDGHCGCSEGYAACTESGKCEKEWALMEGSPCKCYFQCKTGFCSKTGICMKAVNIAFSTVKDVVEVGEATRVTISADNTLDEDVPTKITLNIATGAMMSGVIGGADCSGNQCTGVETVPGKGRTEVAIDIVGATAGELELSATITATIDGKPYQQVETITIHVTKCGDGKCTTGETQKTCCDDCECPKGTEFFIYTCKKNKCEQRIKPVVIAGVIIIASILGVIVLIVKYSIAYSKKREMEKKAREKEAGLEEERREHVRKILSRVRKKINIEKPPEFDELLKRVGKWDRFDIPEHRKILREEYISLLEELEEERKEKMEEKRRKKEEGKRQKEERKEKGGFCGVCGAKVKDGDVYCGECGEKL